MTGVPKAERWSSHFVQKRGVVCTLAVLAAVGGLNNVDRAMLGLLLPKIQQEMALSDLMLGFLTGPAFMIVYSLAGLPLAWLADRWSRRNIIAIGLAFWSAIVAATGLAANAVHLTITRVLLGLGEASSVAPTSAIVGDIVSQRNRALGFAAVGVGTPLATLIAFPVIGWLAETQGWRSAFFAMGAVGLVLAAIMVLVVKEPKRGASEEAPPPECEPMAFGESLGILLRSPGFMLTVAAGGFVGVAFGVLLSWGPTYLERVHGLNTEQTGAYLGLYRGLFGIAGPIFGGVLATVLVRRDIRFGAWVPAAVCVAMVPAECLFLLSDGGIWWQVGLALDTFLVLSLMPTMFALLLTYVDVRMRATGTALNILFVNLVGQGIGPLAVGALSQAFTPSFGVEAIRYAMLIAPIAIFAAAILFYASARVGRAEPDLAIGSAA